MSGMRPGARADPVRLGILISGRGSNMLALLAAARTDPEFGAVPVLVISNRPEAPGLILAAEQGIACIAIDHKAFPSRADFEQILSETLQDHRIELVAMAGFMRVLGSEFIRHWSGRLLNIHPSLLPAYSGLHTHKRVLEAGGAWHGCSVHLVSEGVDEGLVLAQARLPVERSDTPEFLADRVLALEHGLYPACVAGVARRFRYPDQDATL